MPRLENWSLTVCYGPKLDLYSLQGRVYNHPRFEDGTPVVTSRLESIDEDHHFITHSESVYTLGEIDPNYERIYPNAKKRLIDRMKKNQASNPEMI